MRSSTRWEEPIGKRSSSDEELEILHGYEDEHDDLEQGYDRGWAEEVDRDSRDYVRWVQRALNSILGFDLKVDGVLGARTRRAVRALQKKFSLAVDGIVGPQTEAILIMLSLKPPPSSSQPAGPSMPASGASTLADRIAGKRGEFGVTVELERIAARFYGGRTVLRAIKPGDIARFIPMVRAHQEHIAYSLSLVRKTSLRGYASARDIPLVLALATRESGRTVFRTDTETVVSAGRDTHPSGVSGLDFLYNLRRYFNEADVFIGKVDKNDLRRGREDRKPGLIQARHLLFAHMVKSGSDEKVFRGRHIGRAVRKAGLTLGPEPLFGQLHSNARRAWMSLYYSGPGFLLHTLNDVAGALQRQGRPIDLNQILKLPVSVFRHKPRVILARATSLRAYVIERASQ